MIKGAITPLFAFIKIKLSLDSPLRMEIIINALLLNPSPKEDLLIFYDGLIAL
jgi:hypothetical protein